jgi:hypothetical protein
MFLEESAQLYFFCTKACRSNGSQVLLDCCTREMKRVKEWGQPNSLNVIMEDLTEVRIASMSTLATLHYNITALI